MYLCNLSCSFCKLINKSYMVWHRVLVVDIDTAVLLFWEIFPRLFFSQ